MNQTETPTHPADAIETPEPARLAAGSPEAIRISAEYLMANIRAGSVDGASFAANVQLALDALGVQVPPMFAPAVAQALAGGYES